MKPVLLGMNNPHSSDPDRALGVRPVNASGYKLWQMLAISGLAKEPPVPIGSGNYEDGFTRYNLIECEVFDPAEFTAERRALTLARLKDRVVVMCGTNVPTILGLKFRRGFELKPEVGYDFTYYVIPHPSGLCREYNDPTMRSKVGDLLLMLYLLGATQ